MDKLTRRKQQMGSKLSIYKTNQILVCLKNIQQIFQKNDGNTDKYGSDSLNYIIPENS